MQKQLVVASLALGLAFFVQASDANACGGCFAPQEVPTVVTDHRMIMTIGRNESTLYDQIRYTGSPSSFAWVLPIAGEVKVGLSADVVFEALDQRTQTRIQAPPQNCPAPPNCSRSTSTSDNAGAAPSPEDPGVQVTKRETVGPYDTVQLKATDPQALEKWLSQNGFSIPEVVKPVIAQYVAEHFDFLALKLLPGKEVTDMRPVRVTTPGANVVLPLRMVAAGTGANVGVTLWTLAEGRYAPQNFPTFTITADEIEWDWTNSKSTYTDLRAAKTAAGQGKAWEIESSTGLSADEIRSYVTYGGGGQEAYLPVKDPNGNVTKTAAQVREEDVQALVGGIATNSVRVTRLRADLAQSALATDLALAATADQSELSTVRVVTREKNQPLCPVYNGCEQVGTAPRDVAASQSGGSGESFSCALEARPNGPTKTPFGWLAAGAAALGAVLVRASRQRLRKR